MEEWTLLMKQGKLMKFKKKSIIPLYVNASMELDSVGENVTMVVPICIHIIIYDLY